MKQPPAPPQLAAEGQYRQTFRQGEAVLLTASARWPRFREDAPGLKRINRYYDALADRWQKRWEGPLLARAKAACGPETPPWQADMTFTLTLFTPELFSLYLDITEDTGGRRPHRLRLGDTWHIPSGVPLTLRELLPRQRWWRRPVLAEVRRQIGARLTTGEAVYYDDWLSLVSRRFSPDRFYLTGNGPVLFYPPETIAPPLEGFPTFPLSALLVSRAEKPDEGAEIPKEVAVS